MKRILLHIGTEKTGTTTLQTLLQHNRSVLRKKGFHVLQSAGKGNHWILAAHCAVDDGKFDEFFCDCGMDTPDRRRRFKQEFLRAFRSEIESLPGEVHTLIVSSEHFHSRTNSIHEISRVHDLLSPLAERIEILCYLREQARVCSSSYSTSVKVGYEGDLSKHMKGCNPNNRYYNYYKMIEDWATVFGKENIRLRLFEKRSWYRNDLASDFFRVLDPALVDAIDRTVEVENESLSVKGLMLGRVVNRIVDSSGMRDSLRPARNKAITVLAREYGGGGMLLSRKDYDRIYQAFEPWNRRLNREYLDGEDQNCFTYEPPVDDPEPAILTEEDVEKMKAVFESLWSHVISRQGAPESPKSNGSTGRRLWRRLTEKVGPRM